MSRALLLLLAILALLASGPVHDGLHHREAGPQGTQVELHGEDCEHFEGITAHDDECSFCAVARVVLDVVTHGPAAVQDDQGSEPTERLALASPTSWSRRAHGARAPPANG